MHFTEEDKKVCEEHIKHFKINIFENSAYADQHKCFKLLESSLLRFSYADANQQLLQEKVSYISKAKYIITAMCLKFGKIYQDFLTL